MRRTAYIGLAVALSLGVVVGVVADSFAVGTLTFVSAGGIWVLSWSWREIRRQADEDSKGTRP